MSDQTEESGVELVPLSPGRSWALSLVSALVAATFINALGLIDWFARQLHDTPPVILEVFIAFSIFIAAVLIVRLRLTWFRITAETLHCMLLWVIPVIIWSEIFDYEYFADVHMPVSPTAAGLLIGAVFLCSYIANVLEGKSLKDAIAYGAFGGAFQNGMVLWLLYGGFILVAAFVPAALERQVPDLEEELPPMIRPATAEDLQRTSDCLVIVERTLRCTLPLTEENRDL